MSFSDASLHFGSVDFGAWLIILRERRGNRTLGVSPFEAIEITPEGFKPNGHVS